MLYMPATLHENPLRHSFHGKIARLMLSLLVIGILSQAAHADLEHYRLAAGDTVSITVYNEPDLSLKKTRVATNGTIAVPLLGQIKVSDLTIAEVESELSTLFADGYLKTPAIAVTIDEYRLFYINGEVKKPGGYSYRDGLTVHKAVTLAGGFTERAAKGSITLIHEKEPKKSSKRVKLTEHIRPGDIITIKESFF